MSACDLSKPFGTPGLVTAVDTLGRPFITADGLQLYYSDAATNSIHVATRPNLTVGFGPATPTGIGLDQVISYLMGVHVSADGLQLYYSGKNARGWEFSLGTASRSSTSSSWAKASSPALPGTRWQRDAWLSRDGRRLYYAHIEGANADQELAVSELTASGFGAMRMLDELGGEGRSGEPVLSADELTIYFSTSRPSSGTGTYNIWTANRPSVDAPFANIREVVELASSSAQSPVQLSDDGCVLHFVSSGTLEKLYVAAKPK